MAPAFSYELADDRIAQRPVYPYDSARMLVLNRADGSFRDQTFSDIVDLLASNDVLVFNDSRVIPARLFGNIAWRAGEIEILLLRPEGPGRWVALGRPLKKLPPGTVVEFGESLKCTVLERVSEYQIRTEFATVGSGIDVRDAIKQAGIMPIPPYIRNGRADEKDLTDYQSMFADADGSVAAPTASLHFTPALIDKIRKAGVGIEFVRLHVGSASFLPLMAGADAAGYTPPGSERFEVSPHVINRLKSVRRNGGRVIAVGTTVVRALESAAGTSSEIAPGETSLFIQPGYEFKLVDAIITNFHQSSTTHLLLVEAFVGRAQVERMYAHALTSGYRFLSYGDGSFLC